MGIRGLQSYLENCCPGAFYDVDIGDLARRHVAEHGTEPVVVVDAMSCINTLYSRYELDWVCGGQFSEYVSAWEDFLAAFAGAGIRLVFVFDGTTVMAKRQEWVRRRYETMSRKVQG